MTKLIPDQLKFNQLYNEVKSLDKQYMNLLQEKWRKERIKKLEKEKIDLKRKIEVITSSKDDTSSSNFISKFMTKLLPLLIMFVLCGCDGFGNLSLEEAVNKRDCENVRRESRIDMYARCEILILQKDIQEIKELLKAQKGKQNK